MVLFFPGSTGAEDDGVAEGFVLQLAIIGGCHSSLIFFFDHWGCFLLLVQRLARCHGHAIVLSWLLVPLISIVTVFVQVWVLHSSKCSPRRNWSPTFLHLPNKASVLVHQLVSVPLTVVPFPHRLRRFFWICKAAGFDGVDVDVAAIVSPRGWFYQRGACFVRVLIERKTMVSAEGLFPV